MSRTRLAAAVRRLPSSSAALLTLGLVACAHYQARPLHPAQSAQAFAARRLDAPALRQAVTPLLTQPAAAWPPRWNRASLLAVALVENPELAVARAQIGAAQAHEITARQLPNPTVGLQAEYALHDAKPWLYGISFDLPLRSPTRRRLQTELARIATGNARFALMDHVWAVRRELITALSDWHGALQRTRLLQRLVDAQRQLVTLTQRRVKAGEDAAATLSTTQALLLDDQRRQAQAMADLIAARTATAAALGLPVAALAGITPGWSDWGDPPAVPAGKLADAREQALLSRADLARAIGDYAAADARLRLAIARQYPQFDLSPGYYWDHGVHKFPLGVSFSLPIFNQNQGEIAEARAGRRLAGARVLAVQAGIDQVIDGSAAAEAVARTVKSAADARLQAARQQARRSRRALQLGAVDRGAVLATSVELLRARLAQLDAAARLQTARNALEDALHTPLSGPELALRRPPPAAAAPGATP